MSSLFPNSVTEIGARADMIQFWLILLMAFWFIACNAVLIYFAIKYKRKGPDDVVSTVRGNHTLEVIWTVVPSIIVIIIFIAGIDVWTDMRILPENEDYMEVKVTAQKWSWSFQYQDPDHVFGENLHNKVVPQDIYLPVGLNIQMTMKSTDVLHSLFIPEFRVKEDITPSRYTQLWFRADIPGSYNIFCTEYCGDLHSGMLGKVHILDQTTWERYINGLPLDPRDKPLTPLENGEKLYTKHNCKGCHSIDGNKIIGPTFLGLMDLKERQFADGSSNTFTQEVDVTNYISRSIKTPNSQVVEGYPADQMPAFDGLINDDEIEDIITYIKSLKN